MGFHIVKRENCPLWKKAAFYLGAIALALLLGGAILMAIGVFITGAILNDRSLQIRTFSAVLLIMMASCHIVFMKEDFYWYYITFSLGFIVMLVMPGYHLNKEAKKHVQRT